MYEKTRRVKSEEENRFLFRVAWIRQSVIESESVFCNFPFTLFFFSPYLYK